ncbi:hypothetical protein GALMADRAFT_152068 [Galerina marginata CBS 339.88]|uniref:Peptidase A2 domain-containing protein n=1 Tax=Galerina marginata (strain CBS 339.88) TaxID=685588 RepID=A0A067TL72_GALM3|nr:hypothetical protein GALMADRAFT_152068 [Galerina marginata CBS 339.88]
MTILITGGTGRTGGKLAQLLHAANQPVLIASRSGVAPAPFKAVKFDWTDEKTFGNPFEADSNIDKIYLVVPPIIDVFPVVKPFIDLALSKGVKRIVLCGSSSVEKGGPGPGKVFEYLVDSGADYVVLRPTWFIDNFGAAFLREIVEHDKISTAAGDGRIPFVGVDDIAKAAFDALVVKESPNTDYYVQGPKLYTHDEATAILGEVLGRKITHERVTEEQAVVVFMAQGTPEHYAKIRAWLATRVANGKEEVIFTSPKAIHGKTDLRDYFEANKKLWAKE